MNLEQIRKYIMNYFKDLGFTKNVEINSFLELNKAVGGNKIISIVLNNSDIYIMIRSISTNEYIFSNMYKYNIPDLELIELLDKMSKFQELFTKLF